MLLTYADQARLYVPVERLDLVQKFSSGKATLRHSTASEELPGRRPKHEPNAPYEIG
jgi:transcription-repair coupling factor (superfamily II helicase)